jgi:hypothetical protein
MSNLKILRREVLRYMGHKGEADELLMRDVISAIEIVKDLAQPKYVYSFCTWEKANNGILLKEPNLLLEGEDISRFLKSSVKVALFAATLGSEIDRAIRYHTSISPSLGLAVDAAATAAIESLCDDVCRSMVQSASIGLDIVLKAKRFSCGYGDLPLEIQPKILTFLDCHRKMGLCTTDTYMLTPQKSVTAVVKFSERAPDMSAYQCRSCSRAKNCPFKM